MPDPQIGPCAEHVLGALKKVLESRTFSSAPNLIRLLQFCIEETLAGRRQSQIAIAKVLRYRNFDPQQDSTVRREMGRLRSKLRDYYDSEGPTDPVIISVPKASSKDGYCAQFQRRHEIVGESESPRYLQLISEARHMWGKRAPSAVLDAIRLYQEATQEDPQHAGKAQIGLAESYAFLVLCGFPAHETLPQAREWAAKATTSDPENATSFAILGFIAGAYDWNWPEADQLFYKALALAPQATEVRCWYASHLICTSRFSEAILQARKAQSLEHEPSAVVLSHVAKILHVAGDLDHAFDVLQLSLQINPHFHITHELLGLLLLDRGDGDVGLTHLQKANELAPESSSVIASRGYGLAVLGHRNESVADLQTLERLNERRYVPATDFATIYAGLDEIDSAFDALERAFSERCIYLTWLHTWPPYRSLQGDRRFAEMGTRLGLNWGQARLPTYQRP